MKFKTNLFDENAVRRAIIRIAHEIIEKNSDLSNLCVMGIKTRGIPIAERLAKEIYNIENKKVEVSSLDISFYRDDLSLVSAPEPTVNEKIEAQVAGKNIILVDDVIYTGRTVRAALDAILSKGRADKIQLAVIVDRGHRELPIRPDYVGKNIPTSKNEIIKVNIFEIDGVDGVELFEK